MIVCKSHLHVSLHSLQLRFRPNGEYYTEGSGLGWVYLLLAMAIVPFTAGLSTTVLNIGTLILMRRKAQQHQAQTSKAERNLTVQAIVLSLNTIGYGFIHAVRTLIFMGFLTVVRCIVSVLQY